MATQVRWDEIDGKNLQDDVISLTPEEFGNRFTTFIKNGARPIIIADPKVLAVNQPFDPVTFIGPGWSFIQDERDLRSSKLTEVDFSKVIFDTCLKKGETSILGEEKFKRLIKKKKQIRLGANVGQAFWQDYQTNKENSILEWIRRTHKITYLDFFGDPLLGPSGHRNVLYLYFSGGVWLWSVGWLGAGWPVVHSSAGLATFFVSPHQVMGSFCFPQCNFIFKLL